MYCDREEFYVSNGEGSTEVRTNPCLQSVARDSGVVKHIRREEPGGS